MSKKIFLILVLIKKLMSIDFFHIENPEISNSKGLLKSNATEYIKNSCQDTKLEKLNRNLQYYTGNLDTKNIQNGKNQHTSQTIYSFLVKGQKIYYRNELAEYTINENAKVNIYLTNLNSQISTSIFNPISLFKDSKLLVPEKEYYINYNISDSSRYVQPYYNIVNSEKKIEDYFAGCNYTTFNPKFNYKTITGLKYKVNDKFRANTFSFSPDILGIYLLIVDDLTVNYKVFDNYINSDYISGAYYQLSNITINLSKDLIKEKDTKNKEAGIVNNSTNNSTIVTNQTSNNTNVSNSTVLNNTSSDSNQTQTMQNVKDEMKENIKNTTLNNTEELNSMINNSTNETNKDSEIIMSSENKANDTIINNENNNNNLTNDTITDFYTNYDRVHRREVKIYEIPRTNNFNFDKVIIIDQPYDLRNYVALYNRIIGKLAIYELLLDESGFINEALYYCNLYIRNYIKLEYLNYVYDNKTIELITNKTETNLETNNLVNYFNYTDGFEVKKVGIYGDYLIIGCLQGLFILKKINNKIADSYEYFVGLTTFVYKKTKEEFNMRVLTFQIIQKTIFILVEKFGVIQLNLSDLNHTDFQFYNPYVKDMDLNINPIKLTKYLGILIENGRFNNEFFIEINIDEEFFPYINKVLTYSSTLDIKKIISVDLFYSYLYDNNEKKIYLIRRNMINDIPYATYVINAFDYFSYSSLSNKNAPISIYNKFTKENEFAIYDNDYIISLNNLTFPSDHVECIFNKYGHYNLTLEKYSEQCKASEIYNYAYSYCVNLIYLNFYVIEPKSSKTGRIIAIFFGILGFIIFMIIGVICYFRISINKEKKKKPPPSRYEMYLDNYLSDKKREIETGIINNKVNFSPIRSRPSYETN